VVAGADEALGFAVRIVDDEFDEVDALGRPAGSGATSAHKLGQLGA